MKQCLLMKASEFGSVTVGVFVFVTVASDPCMARSFPGPSYHAKAVPWCRCDMGMVHFVERI